MADLASNLLSRRRHLLDLSMVPILGLLRDDLPKNSLVVPATLDELLSGDPSPKLAQLLTDAVMPSNPTKLELRDLNLTLPRLKEAMAAYSRLAQRGVIHVIRDENVSDPELLRLLESLGSKIGDTPSVTLKDGTSMTPVGLARKHIGTMVTYSKRTRTAILASGRSLTSRLRGTILVLDLPDEVTALRKKKQALTKRYLVRTPNAETAKIIVGIAMAGAGVFSVNPALAIGGLAVAVLDP